MRSIVRRASRALASFVAVAAAPHAAHAQYTPIGAYTQSAWIAQRNVLRGGSFVNSDGFDKHASTMPGAYSTWGTADATYDLFGGVHVSGSLFGSLAPDLYAGGPTTRGAGWAFAESYFRETIDVSGVDAWAGPYPPDSVRFHLHVDGTASASVTGYGNGMAAAWNSFSFRAFGTGIGWNDVANVVAYETDPTGRGSRSQSIAYAKEVYIAVPFQYWLGFEYGMTVDAELGTYGMPTGDEGTGAAIGDFSHTAKLVDVRFIGRNGADITSAVHWRFAGGTELPQTTTPEPATWLLLGTGVAAIVLVQRRARGARQPA